jgi:cell shape-determining protein MreD
MQALVIGLNALAGLASLAMSGYGLLILLLTRLDPLRTDYVGIALGSGLLVTFLVVPAFCVTRSVRLATTKPHAAIYPALVPFALFSLALVVIRAVPWPPPP